LADLLAGRNGFYAFGDALLVRGIGRADRPHDLASWNTPRLWMSHYRSFDLGAMLFFSEDAFGNQFALTADDIVWFDAETAVVERIAKSLNAWAAECFSETAWRTGQKVLREWRARHGPLPRGQRLIPRVPLVLGGEGSADCVGPINEVEAMAFRARLATAIRDLPDGAQITFDITD
jgi:hypothetical protein